MFRILTFLFLTLASFSSHRIQGQEDQKEFDKIRNQLQKNDDLLQRIIKLSSNQPLLKELEILGEQSNKLRQFAVDHIQSVRRLKSQSFQLQVKELSGNLSEIEKQRLKAEKKNNIRQLALVTSQSLKKLDDILLVHQVRRLKQISLQQQKIDANKFGDEFGIVLELTDELKLSKTSKEDLEKKIDEIRKAYYRKVKQLKADAVDQVLNELDKSQKARYLDLIGEHYDLNAAQR